MRRDFLVQRFLPVHALRNRLDDDVALLEQIQVLVVVGSVDVFGPTRNGKRAWFEFFEAFYRLADKVVRVALLGRQFEQHALDIGIDEVRGDLRSHDAGAEDGDLADFQQTLDWHGSRQSRRRGPAAAAAVGILKAYRVLDAENIYRGLIGSRHSAEQNCVASRLVDLGIVREQVRVSEIELSGLADLVGAAQRNPYAVGVREPYRPITVVYRRFVERRAHFRRELIRPPVVQADRVSHRVVEVEDQSIQRGAACGHDRNAINLAPVRVRDIRQKFQPIVDRLNQAEREHVRQRDVRRYSGAQGGYRAHRDVQVTLQRVVDR